MPLDKQSTTLRQAPYYDDYDETKNFHRVLFKPSVAVQARELTQLQTILQSQIERFGDNIYTTGTIIKGCSLTVDTQYYYVKLFDLQPSGASYDITTLANTYVVDTNTDLKALVVNYVQGGQQLDPDLNTLYVKYLNTGTGGVKQYSNNSVLTVYNRNYRVESVEVLSGGSSYSNNDTVVFTSNTGTGAHAAITTYANGVIRTVTMTDRGTGYTTAPTVSVTTNTGSSASLLAYNYLAQVQAANSLYTANGTSTPIGVGSAIKTTDGVVYQKGHFIRVEAHEAILSKYNTTPNGVAVGFVTSESVVNSNADQTLLDNAGGTTNYTAPGADRLKLTSTLTVLSSANAAANNEFLSLYEFEDGRVVKDRTQTEFNSVGKELARRTFEESGNYVVTDFPMYTESIANNSTQLNLNIGAGVAYIQGKRIQLVNNVKYPIDKGTDSLVSPTQTISTNYGGYVLVNEYMGKFDIVSGVAVALYGDITAPYGRQAISTNVGIGAPSGGTQVGTARVRSVVYDSGIPGTSDCVYRVYLFDVTMNAGRTFREVRSLYYAPSGSATAVADVIWDSTLGYATQYDAQYDSLLFNSGTFAVKVLESETVISRGSLTGASVKFNAAGLMDITLSSNTTFPYTAGSTLNSIQKRDFIVIPATTAQRSADANGTITFTTGQSNVVGTSTRFSVEYSVGDYIKVGAAGDAGDIRLITSISSNTLMTVSGTFTVSNTSITHRPVYPANVPINLSSTNKTATLIGSDRIQINIGGINAETLVTMYYDYKQTTPVIRQKTANTYYTKISNTSVTANPNGPWCIGIPDVVKLTGVYIGTDTGDNVGYASAVASTNRIADFVLDNGQTDNFYGLAYVKKKPGSSLAISPSSCLVFTYKALTHGPGSYISTESYGNNVINDTTTPLPSNRIRTQDVPVFVSPKTGKSYDLRDVIDFRPMVANTAAYALVLTDATVSPAPATSDKFDLAVDKMFPSPTREFEAQIESYLARRDRVVIDTYGQIRIVRGYPSNNPSAPAEPEGSMTIGVVTIPQYPSLSAKDASDAGRPDLGVYVTPQQNRRFTMKDISDIENRISRLEYYTLLNTLETNTKQLVLPSEANSAIERFKNGFFVDPLSDYNVSNIQDLEYKILIDSNKGIARPYFADTKIDLKFDTNNAGTVGTVQTGDLLSLNYNTGIDKPIITQPIATRDRTLVDQQWRYAGKVRCIPAFDNFYDVGRSAVSIKIDIASPLNALARATSAAFSELKVSSSLLGTVDTNDSAVLINRFGNDNGNITEVYSQNVTKTFQDTKVKLNGGSVTEANSYLGEFVNDVSLKEYIREQRIGFIATGLRPGAAHHVFFDQDLMDTRVTPATVDMALASPVQTDFISTGTLGQTLTANSSGCAAGLIDIPAGTYFIGDHSVIVMDVDNVASESTATSKSIGQFIGFTHAITKTDLSVSTKSVSVAGAGSYSAQTYLSDAYTLSDRRTYDREVVVHHDPLSQTFRVQSQLADTEGIFVTSVDLFFKQKDPVQGVSVAIHETTDEGTPSQVVVPFSQVHLSSNAVNVSTDASAATRFTFQSPVYLKTDGNYALVVSPDAYSPEYRVYTAVVGGTDLTNPSLVCNQNWGLGSLFYSTSGSAWSAVQDEDLKFTLNRAEFSTTSGTAVLTNDDYEFATIANGSIGTFRGGEDIAQLHPNTYISGVINTTTTNNVVTTTTDLTAQISVGTNLLLIYGGSQTLKTANVAVTGTSVAGYSSETPTFDTEYTVGDFVKFGNSSVGEIRQVIARTPTTMTIDAPLSITSTNLRHYQIGSPTFQVANVKGITSSTITLNKPPKVATSSTVQLTAQKAVVGVVDSYNYSENRVYINKSTAAGANFKMYAANTTYRGMIVGDTSQARADIVSLDNVAVNFFRPVFSTIVAPGTSITMKGTTTKSNGTTTSTLDDYELGMINRIPYNDYAVIKSKSNEFVIDDLTKSFTIKLDFTSADTDISPVLDINPTSIVVTRNIVDNYTNGTFIANTTVSASKNIGVANTSGFVAGMAIRGVGIPSGTTIASITNSTSFAVTNAATANGINVELSYSSNETSRYGINKSKYISKRLELTEGMDAEDAKIFITAYKPNGTAVDVYAKVLNGTDGDSFDSKDWTLLEQTTSSTVYSDSLNEEDYREFEYTFPQTPPSTVLAGVATAANTAEVLGTVVIANTTGGFSCTSTANLVIGSAITVTGANTTAITGYTEPTTYRVSAKSTSNTTHFTMTSVSGTALVTTAGTPTGLTFTAPAAVIGVDTAFTTNLAVGDLIKVVKSNSLTDYDVAQVATIVNDTILYTTSPISFRANGCKVEKFDQRSAAFKYNRNPAGNIVRYYSNSGIPFDTYKYLALKVVLRSQYNYLVPTLNDIRALAVSI